MPRFENLQLSRREFTKLGVVTSILVALGLINHEKLFNYSQESKNTEPWPTDKEAILQRINELDFKLGSELGTTVFLRKIMWEMAQLSKQQGQWVKDEDESDWLTHLDVVKPTLETLKHAGLKRVRLVVVPFELTQDGQNFDWTAMDKAIELMYQLGLQIDLAIGPLDYPEYPGIRLPFEIQQRLDDEMSRDQLQQIYIGLEPDHHLPQLSQEIKEYSLHFLTELLKKYGNDDRVDSFHLSNEWHAPLLEEAPVYHGIEGLDAEKTMQVGEDLMIEFAKLCQQFSTEPISLNTNLHADEPDKIEQGLGKILRQLGSQGKLGFDVYPSQAEYINPGINQQTLEKLKTLFPETAFYFAEFQAEPFITGENAGKSWAELIDQNPQFFIDYFQKKFPPTLELATSLPQIMLWGGPLLIILTSVGYEFPQEMFHTIAVRMGDQQKK